MGLSNIAILNLSHRQPLKQAQSFCSYNPQYSFITKSISIYYSIKVFVRNSFEINRMNRVVFFFSIQNGFCLCKIYWQNRKNICSDSSGIYITVLLTHPRPRSPCNSLHEDQYQNFRGTKQLCRSISHSNCLFYIHCKLGDNFTFIFFCYHCSLLEKPKGQIPSISQPRQKSSGQNCTYCIYFQYWRA